MKKYVGDVSLKRKHDKENQLLIVRISTYVYTFLI